MEPTCKTCHDSGYLATFYCTTSEQKTKHPVCKGYFVPKLQREHIITISKEKSTYLGTPYTFYLAILDDNTEVALVKEYWPICQHIISSEESRIATPIQISYFNIIKNIFKEMQKLQNLEDA